MNGTMLVLLLAPFAPASALHLVAVQGGGSLRTWSFSSAAAVSLSIESEGRPVDADVELWVGPDNAPCKVRVYSDDGHSRPVSCLVPCDAPSTLAVRNIGPLSFPLSASAESVRPPPALPRADFRPVQGGGGVRSFPFPPSGREVEVVLATDGRPMNARVEVLQGPTNARQVVEAYSQDGERAPLHFAFLTPWGGSVVRVLNTGPLEFPLFACAREAQSRP